MSVPTTTAVADLQDPYHKNLLFVHNEFERATEMGLVMTYRLPGDKQLYMDDQLRELTSLYRPQKPTEIWVCSADQTFHLTYHKLCTGIPTKHFNAIDDLFSHMEMRENDDGGIRVVVFMNCINNNNIFRHQLVEEILVNGRHFRTSLWAVVDSVKSVPVRKRVYFHHKVFVGPICDSASST